MMQRCRTSVSALLLCSAIFLCFLFLYALSYMLPWSSCAFESFSTFLCCLRARCAGRPSAEAVTVASATSSDDAHSPMIAHLYVTIVGAAQRAIFLLPLLCVCIGSHSSP